MRVLAINAGSSSLKLRLLDRDDTLVFSQDLPAERGRFDLAAVRHAISALEGGVDAVGHRVVHGGTLFTGPVLIDESVERALHDLVDLAPLHQPKSLAGIDVVRGLLPDVPAIACFDTAFHATLPAAAATYAVPESWRKEFGVRRYGFHGLSHAYASRRAAELVSRPVAALRVVTCHLGAGASLAAVESGHSVDTTMGFTPLEGLAMATRSGSVDPGLITWLIEHAGLAVSEVAEALEHRSGMLALAGTADMGHIEATVEPNQRSRLAHDVYVHRLRAGIASMASAMDGLDVLVFTGGVGENAPSVRAAAAAGLGFLGIHLDEGLNRSLVRDGEVTAHSGGTRTMVVTAREDLQIAGEVRSLLS